MVAVVDAEYSDPTQNFSGLFSLQQQQLSQTKICTQTVEISISLTILRGEQDVQRVEIRGGTFRI